MTCHKHSLSRQPENSNLLKFNWSLLPTFARKSRKPHMSIMITFVPAQHCTWENLENHIFHLKSINIWQSCRFHQFPLWNSVQWKIANFKRAAVANEKGLRRAIAALSNFKCNKVRFDEKYSRYSHSRKFSPSFSRRCRALFWDNLHTKRWRRCSILSICSGPTSWTQARIAFSKQAHTFSLSPTIGRVEFCEISVTNNKQ